MFLAKYQSELEFCLARAAELLGGPALPVRLEWEMEQTLRRQLKLELRRGLGREPAVLRFDRSKRGHEMEIGVERHRWETREGPLRVVRVVVPCGPGSVEDFWAVPAADYRRFYRCLRAETEGWSFAELEEARKLLVLRRLDTAGWDWPAVRDSLTLAAAPRRPRPIGFVPNVPDFHPTPAVCAKSVGSEAE